MRYLSVCSGIEAATVAWHPLGWTPVAFAEVEKFPAGVLKHHYPTVPNWGDITKFREWPDATIDVLVGGTPCQSFSVAGLRKGLGDPRGNLALTFLAIADRYRPRWVVWENVPGVLSSIAHDAPHPCEPPPPVDLGRDGAIVDTTDEYDADESHAFSCLLAGFSELGYFGAYGTLDAQYFHLAQRRARVFAVFYLGDWRRAAAVLFERESLSGHPAPRREAGQRVAGTIASRTSAGGGLGTDFDCDGGLIPERERALTSSNQRIDYETETLIAHGYHETGQGWWTEGPLGLRAEPGGMPENLIAHSLRADGFDASEDGTGRGCPLVPVAFSVKDHGADAGDIAPTLRAGGHDGSHANGGVMPAVAFNWQSGGDARGLQAQAQAQALSRSQTPAMQHGMQVRRLTPRECERLQGFPDDYTLIPFRGKPAADGPRYKALGNSMAVPVMRWIGERIALVNALVDREEVA